MSSGPKSMCCLHLCRMSDVRFPLLKSRLCQCLSSCQLVMKKQFDSKQSGVDTGSGFVRWSHLKLRAEGVSEKPHRGGHFSS